jgi:Acetyltransferase (GNAT) family
VGFRHHEMRFLRFLSARISEAWVRKDNKRLSGFSPDWTDKPTYHALIIESIIVDPPHRDEGICRAFLRWVIDHMDDFDCELVICEGVGNEVLAAALERWGWDFDPAVSDFYWFKETSKPRKSSSD